MRVLLVEDERTIAVTLGDDLVDAGHHVVHFDDGAAAIEGLRRQEFDCVVTDLRLPGADGLSVLEAARASSADIGVVVITAHASVERAADLMRRGADDLVRKPFLNDDLIARIENVAAARRAARNGAR